MRQRYLKFGADNFADHELLELLLFFSIPRVNVNPLAHDLLDRYGSLSAVLGASMESLKKTKGVGDNTAILITLLSKLVQRAEQGQAERILNTTQRAGTYLMGRFFGEDQEIVYQLCLDRKGKLLSCDKIGLGGICSVVSDLRTMVLNASAVNASSVILSHNHPSGVALPSQEDYDATAQVRKALETVHIELRDHIIVADGDYVSMRDSGFLE